MDASVQQSGAISVRVLLYAIACGALLGVAARIAMRFVARESGLDSAFSVGGSFEVVAFGALIGAPIALLFFVFRRRVDVPAPWLGLLFGLVLFLLFAVIPPPAARSALADTPDTPVFTAITFAALFLGWGWVLEWVGRRLVLRA